MIVEDIKKELLNNPDKLAELIEEYNYYNIRIHNTYISFGRSEDTSSKSIVIRLEKNDWLYVTDYPKNINQEFFAYLIEQRNTDFQSIMLVVKRILGISDFETRFRKKSLFGGIYDKAKTTREETKLQTYEESILNNYLPYANMRFIKDKISVEVQKKFKIGYDLESSGITIPIRNEVGDLIGIKERCNYESNSPDFQKYWYKIPCLSSQTLYGFSQNYEKIVGNKKILVFEAEKSVMQCNSYGVYTAVGLGSGTISKKQIHMILSCHPDEILFLHDNLYDKSAIMKNIAAMKGYGLFFSAKVGYWDWSMADYKDKVSPSDMGKKELDKILATQIKYV